MNSQVRKLGKKRAGASGGVLDKVMGGIMGIVGIAGLLILASSFFGDQDLEAKVAEPTKHIANGLTKYKNNYFESNGTYLNLEESTSQTFMRPLKYDSTGFLFPKGDSDVKYYVGNHGASGYEHQYAYACMDSSAKAWNAEDNLDAENKFASKIKAYFTSPKVKIIGTQTSEFSSASAATTATSSAPNTDGIICATHLN